MSTYRSQPLTGAVEPSRGATTTQEHYGERRWQVDSQSCVLAVELIQTSEITAKTGRLCAATATIGVTGWPGSAPRAGRRCAPSRCPGRGAHCSAPGWAGVRRDYHAGTTGAPVGGTPTASGSP